MPSREDFDSIVALWGLPLVTLTERKATLLTFNADVARALDEEEQLRGELVASSLEGNTRKLSELESQLTKAESQWSVFVTELDCL